MRKAVSVMPVLPVLALALLLLSPGRAAGEDHALLKQVPRTECNECHKASGISPNHTAFWNVDHKIISVKTGANCRSCHEQLFCLDCHYGGGIAADLSVSTDRRGDTLPKSHRSDYREIHPLYAKGSAASCEKCHSRNFCVDCHRKFRPEELRFQSHRRQYSEIMLSSVGPNHAAFTAANCPSCHPGGLLPKHQWSDSHAREARRNLASCQSCHNDGESCMKCHSARSGLRVKPHPDNWSSMKGRLERAGGKRTCVKCH